MPKFSPDAQELYETFGQKAGRPDFTWGSVKEQCSDEERVKLEAVEAKLQRK